MKIPLSNLFSHFVLGTTQKYHFFLWPPPLSKANKNTFYVMLLYFAIKIWQGQPDKPNNQTTYKPFKQFHNVLIMRMFQIEWRSVPAQLYG